MQHSIRWTVGIAAVWLLPSCATVKVEPVEVKPIHLTMDINIRVQKELNDAFSFEDEIIGSENTERATEPDETAVADVDIEQGDQG